MAEKTGDTSKNNLSCSSIASGPMAASTIREAPEPKLKSSNETDTAASDEFCPEELRAVVEAEKQRVAQKSAQILLCTSAIRGVEAVLSPMATGDNKVYVESMKAYLRAAIGHFINSGPESTPPSLPQRPNAVSPRVPSPKPTVENKPMVRAQGNTWAGIARLGLQNDAGRINTKMAAVPQNVQKTRPKVEADDRLFIRLQETHEWRRLSPSGIREAIAMQTKCAPSDVEHVHRVPTGFAIRAIDSDAKNRLMEASDTLNILGAKLEKPSEIVALRIATVPTAVYTLDGKIQVSPEMVATEIIRVTKCTPTKVRVHGKGKLGASYQEWLAHFPKGSSPKPGFRLFDDSGVATVHRPQAPVLQCKRCLGFHPTRACSRAPACWNCGSTMHISAECKAATKCRNCAGPHRSDSRRCLARPTKSGPPTKEQLVTIRQASQREYSAVARAKAAVNLANKASASAIKSQEILKRTATSTDAPDAAMVDVSGYGVLNPEENL